MKSIERRIVALEAQAGPAPDDAEAHLAEFLTTLSAVELRLLSDVVDRCQNPDVDDCSDGELKSAELIDILDRFERFWGFYERR